MKTTLNFSKIHIMKKKGSLTWTQTQMKWERHNIKEEKEDQAQEELIQFYYFEGIWEDEWEAGIIIIIPPLWS